TTAPTTTTTQPGGGDPGVGTAGNKAGYWMVGSDGAVYNFGDAGQYGGAVPAAGSSAVDLEPTPSGRGYWVVTDKGAVPTRGLAAGLLRGGQRRRRLRLRRRQVLRLHGREEAQRPGAVPRPRRRRRGLLAGGVGRRHLRLPGPLQGLDGRDVAEQAGDRHGPLRRRLPDGRRGRRHLRLLRQAVPRLAGRKPAGSPDRICGGPGLICEAEAMDFSFSEEDERLREK